MSILASLLSRTYTLRLTNIPVLLSTKVYINFSLANQVNNNKRFEQLDSLGLWTLFSNIPYVLGMLGWLRAITLY